MKPEVVFAVYRPRPGKGKALEKLVARHVPLLRKLKLATDRPAVVVRAGDGTLVEVFEWRSGKSADAAHEHPAVAEIWEGMGRIAEFSTLASLPEAARPFPHFRPL